MSASMIVPLAGIGDSGKATSDQVGRGVLRMLLSTRASTAAISTAAALGASWLATHALGGVEIVVPHWYYIPIVFTAVRFGPLGAFVVACTSGLLAGPMSLESLQGATVQEPLRWLSRTGFFVVTGQVMAGLVSPGLPTVRDELASRRRQRSLRRGLEEAAFFVVYQPIVSTESARMIGVEALVRWRHPTLGEISPATFLPIAEATGMIGEIGEHVLRTACQDGAAWNGLRARQGAEPLIVDVNMSGRELEEPNLIDRVAAVLEDTGLPPEQLCIEITESVLVDDIDNAVQQLWGLKALGVKLAVDDFGTGYSSLSAVRRYPIDMLKIDRSFVRSVEHDAQAEAVCGGIVMLAHTLGLTTVAEGIETDAQHSMVTTHGCDLIQGFLFSPPVSPDVITGIVAAERLQREGQTSPHGEHASQASAQTPRL